MKKKEWTEEREGSIKDGWKCLSDKYDTGSISCMTVDGPAWVNLLVYPRRNTVSDRHILLLC